MSLVHFTARSMLASFFVVHGVRALRDPDPLIAEATPVAHDLVTTARRLLPAEWADRIPEDPRTLVRLNGLLQLLGGLGLATGIGRRTSASMLAASLVPHLVAGRSLAATDADEAAANRAVLLRNVSLLGGVSLAALDTEGKPGVVWRAREARRVATRAADAKADQLAKATRRAKREAKDLRRQAEVRARRAARRVSTALR